MKDNIHTDFRIRLLVLVFIGVLSFGCGHDHETGLKNHVRGFHEPKTDQATSSYDQGDEIAVKAPPFSDGIFPCNDCHIDLEPNPVKRELEFMHDDISAMFDHDKDNRWCLDCHDNMNRDSLRLASGKLIGFDESYRLCGQCHGDKLRDWKVGVHGKRTGEWNGPKQYLLCVHCHNPHSPRFESLKPLPPPMRQEDINL